MNQIFVYLYKEHNDDGNDGMWICNVMCMSQFATLCFTQAFATDAAGTKLDLLVISPL